MYSFFLQIEQLSKMCYCLFKNNFDNLFRSSKTFQVSKCQDARHPFRLWPLKTEVVRLSTDADCPNVSIITGSQCQRCCFLRFFFFSGQCAIDRERDGSMINRFDDLPIQWLFSTNNCININIEPTNIIDQCNMITVCLKF